MEEFIEYFNRKKFFFLPKIKIFGLKIEVWTHNPDFEHVTFISYFPQLCTKNQSTIEYQLMDYKLDIENRSQYISITFTGGGEQNRRNSTSRMSSRLR